MQNKNLTSVTIPDTVTYIGESAFGGNPELTAVVIPDSVLVIDNGAFAGNANLASATIGSSVTRIGIGAFSQTGITSIAIPDSVVEIASSAFAACESLTAITFGNSLERIEDSAFWNTGLTSLTFPDSLTFIGSSAFNFNEELVSVTFGSGAATVGNNAFGMTHALESVDFGGVTRIEMAAFMGSALREITIPASVTHIGGGAFIGNIETVTFLGETPPEMNMGSFMWNVLQTVRVPESALAVYSALEWANIPEFEFQIVAVPSGNPDPVPVITRKSVVEHCGICGIYKIWRVTTMTVGDEVTERRLAKRNSDGELLGRCGEQIVFRLLPSPGNGRETGGRSIFLATSFDDLAQIGVELLSYFNAPFLLNLGDDYFDNNALVVVNGGIIGHYKTVSVDSVSREGDVLRVNMTFIPEEFGPPWIATQVFVIEIPRGAAEGASVRLVRN
jgi:hypothetical protein